MTARRSAGMGASPGRATTFGAAVIAIRARRRAAPGPDGPVLPTRRPAGPIDRRFGI